jgi:hypothetical protein
VIGVAAAVAGASFWIWDESPRVQIGDKPRLMSETGGTAKLEVEIQVENSTTHVVRIVGGSSYCRPEGCITFVGPPSTIAPSCKRSFKIDVTTRSKIYDFPFTVYFEEEGVVRSRDLRVAGAVDRAATNKHRTPASPADKPPGLKHH